MSDMPKSLFRIARCSRWGLRALLFGLVLGTAAVAGPTSERGIKGLPSQAWSLPYSQSNADAGASSRYGLRFPLQPAPTHAEGESWILRFDAELDVDAFQRLLRFCYANDRSGLLPSHQHCVQEIPAAFQVQMGQGEDSVSITPQQVIDEHRVLMVWVDLINPIDPGTYVVQLFKQDPSMLTSLHRPLGRWLIRIEHPSFDGADAGE